MNSPDHKQQTDELIARYHQIDDSGPSVELDDAILNYARASTRRPERWIWPVSIAASLLLTVGFLARMGSLPPPEMAEVPEAARTSAESAEDASAVPMAELSGADTIIVLDAPELRPVDVPVGTSNDRMTHVSENESFELTRTVNRSDGNVKDESSLAGQSDGQTMTVNRSEQDTIAMPESAASPPQSLDPPVAVIRPAAPATIQAKQSVDNAVADSVTGRQAPDSFDQDSSPARFSDSMAMVDHESVSSTDQVQESLEESPLQPDSNDAGMRQREQQAANRSMASVSASSSSETDQPAGTMAAKSSDSRLLTQLDEDGYLEHLLTAWQRHDASRFTEVFRHYQKRFPEADLTAEIRKWAIDLGIDPEKLIKPDPDENPARN